MSKSYLNQISLECLQDCLQTLKFTLQFLNEISPNKFNVGGAAILTEDNKNHHEVIEDEHSPAMSEFRVIFEKFCQLYMKNTLTWLQIADLYERDTEASKNVNDETTESQKENAMVINLPFVRCALREPEPYLCTMKELCTTIRCLCDSERTTFFEMHDCWKEISEVTSHESYLAYIYGLAGLANLNILRSDYVKLSMATVSTYFLSLTIPGAKGFKIFDEDVIGHCLQVFGLIERMQKPEIERSLSRHQCTEIWVHLTTLCDDLKLLLRYVFFKDFKNVRDNMLRKLIDILRLNHDRGYANAYAANLHTNCFEIFEEFINAHNGEPEETLLKILSMTMHLHTYPVKPKPPAGGMQISSTIIEHISDWFISCIAKYPRLVVKVLNQYIEFVIVNPVKTWKTEQLQRALDYAAKYDAALFTKCNESCVELLCNCIYAEEAMIRSRSVELIARILQIDSKVDWQMFRHEVSSIPREVHLIKELIDSLCDNNSTVKLRAVQALQTALSKGSPNAQKIVSECIRFAGFSAKVTLPLEPPLSKNEIRYEKPTAPTPGYTFEGYGIVQLAFLNLPENMYEHIFQSSVSNLRRAGISLMESLISLNPLIIFHTKFIAHMLQFAKDPTALVRKQAMLTMDALLDRFPCYPIIWTWCKIIEPMLNDGDPKNTELAINCFHSKVLLNIKPLEQSNKAEHFLPWIIIRTLISIAPRLYLQNCFNLSLKPNLLNSNILSIIESHLLNSNSMEAWIVLNFISGKIKSKEPDALVHMFLSLPSWNKKPNMLIAIEVLASCVNHFSHTALNHAFNHILQSIRDGEMLPVLIGKALDFLVIIDRQSLLQSKNAQNRNNFQNQSDPSKIPWIIELDEHLEESILQGIAEFPCNHSNLTSHLYAYSEVNAMTNKSSHSTIISFVHKYMHECIKNHEQALDSENVRLLNCMITVTGRFSLHDPLVASKTCNIYDRILQAIDHPPIVNSIIVAITDICKKQTQVVERIIERILGKLSSSFIINRLETFKCFEKLVLQDQLKLRDTLLLSLLTTLLDENEELVIRATQFFTEFTTKKNPTLFQKCLMEYPYILNEYKNFENKDSFSEKTIKSSLKGESEIKKRQALYNYFMFTMSEINLIMYFNQLKFIAEKCKTDALMTSKDGFEVVKDVFFILKRVCQLTKEKKSSTENKGEGENKDDDDLASLTELNELTTATTAAAVTNATAGASSSNAGRGRRRRDIATMDDALCVLEKSLVYIPAIFKQLSSVDPSVQECFDELCMSLVKRFPTFINDAQPKEFWSNYVKTNTPAKNKTQKRKEDEDEESNYNSDTNSDDVPLIIVQRSQQQSPSKRIRLEENDKNIMDYVFTPNL